MDPNPTVTDSRNISAPLHPVRAPELTIHYGTYRRYERRAHKAILCRGSVYFERLLTGNYPEATSRIINLIGDDHDGIERMLEYMYTHTIQGSYQANDEDDADNDRYGNYRQDSYIRNVSRWMPALVVADKYRCDGLVRWVVKNIVNGMQVYDWLAPLRWSAIIHSVYCVEENIRPIRYLKRFLLAQGLKLWRAPDDGEPWPWRNHGLRQDLAAAVFKQNAKTRGYLASLARRALIAGGELGSPHDGREDWQREDEDAELLAVL